MLAAALCTLGLSVVGAPAASAEPSAAPETLENCGWATCTKYWSVERTKEFNAEEKAGQVARIAIAGAAASAVGTAASGAGGVAIAGGFIAYGAHFEQQISSAANDSRCLIFKYVPTEGDTGPGTWGSVSASTYDENGHLVKKGNKYCDKANQQDSSRGLFGVFK